jgi:2-polyprenyl-3-methyl-5-hydroxy-6-metoxy-1,4-benzoquinol methylase
VDTEAVAACPVCGEVAREVLHAGLVDRLYGAPGRWDLQRCAACGAGYLDPRPTAAAIGATYEDYYTHTDRPGRAKRGAPKRLRQALRNGYLNARYGYALEPAAAVGRFVVPLLPGPRSAADRYVRELRRPHPGARVLDVGCGDGEFLAEMRAAGWRAEGLDTDARAVARARERGLDVREGTLRPGMYAPESFDAVTLSHVIEHLHDPVAMLGTCAVIVRRDGVVWIATPNLASRGHRRYGRSWRGLEPPRHLVLFTPRALARALTRANLELAAVQRPASAAWVYDASERLAPGRARTHRRRLRAVVAVQDVASALRPARGEELVVATRRVALRRDAAG